MLTAITNAEAMDDRDTSRSAGALSTYQNELAQKDELIAALVHELEQAVEKLDRNQRTGSDRSHGGHSNSPVTPSRDPVELQLPCLDDLQHMAEQWEEEKPCSLLVRIASQLAAVHDLVLNLRRDERPRADFPEIEDRVRRIYHEPEAPIELHTNDVTINESAASWESIKQQILGGDVPAQPVQVDAEDTELLRLMSETPAPANVDFGAADIEALKMAVVERDAYIIQINRLYRSRNTLSIPTDWATLANVPAEMQVRVETLIERLDVQVRLGEVEMSLERARLARERSAIQSEREQIEKHLRRLGLNSIAELDNISAATGTASDRRWMRFLGPNTR